MKHLVPDLKYCKKLKGIVNDSNFYWWIKENKLSQGRGKKPIIKKEYRVNDKMSFAIPGKYYITEYPAPTAGEMIRELDKKGEHYNILNTTKWKLFSTFDDNWREFFEDKKLENALAKALIQLN
jgi:hypothetical protein